MYGITFNYAAVRSLIDDECGAAARLDFMTRYLYVYVYILRIYSGYINIAAAISIYAEPCAARQHFRSASYCSEIWLVGDTYNVVVDLVVFRRIRSNTVLDIELTRNAIVLL